MITCGPNRLQTRPAAKPGDSRRRALLIVVEPSRPTTSPQAGGVDPGHPIGVS